MLNSISNALVVAYAAPWRPPLLGSCSARMCDDELSDQDRQLLAMSDAELMALTDDDGACTTIYEEPPAYEGPTPPSGVGLRGLVCSVDLPEAGLVLEVAESLAGGDGSAGLGLFIRLAENVESVSLDAGVAVCGYAHGTMQSLADDSCGKTVGFWLRQPEASFFFERELHSVASLLLPDGDVTSIAGHALTRDTAGAVSGIDADGAWQGPRYFVPDAEQGELSVMNIGQFSNDLAMPAEGSTAAESEPADYSAVSADCNLVRAHLTSPQHRRTQLTSTLEDACDSRVQSLSWCSAWSAIRSDRPRYGRRDPSRHCLAP